MRAALAVALVSLVALVAGCASPGGESTRDPTPTTTSPTSATPTPPTSRASFEVADLTILPRNVTTRTTLYEDDPGALIRYVVRQPADASRETAFVTYLLNGRITDVSQLTLGPGEEKVYERRVDDLRSNRTISVEVRAGSSMKRAEASVQDWPRAGEGALSMGPLTIRADYGLLEQDGRALVNLTISHNGSAETVRDFRVKMLCVGDDGDPEETQSVRLPAPEAGNTTSLDASVQDCPPGARYGLEFKGTGAEGPLAARLLLVEKGWRPPASS